MSARCLFTGWVLAWAVTVFLPGVVQTGLMGAELTDVPARVWRFADDISPWAKLAIGGQLVLYFWLLRRARAALWLSVGTGLLAVGTVLAILPASLSGGYGVGLTGVRFEPVHTAIYLVAGAAGGIVFAFVKRRCEARA